MKITKAEYDALPDGAMKAAFTQIEGSEDFSNGEEDAGALKNALESEKAAKVKAAQERDALRQASEAEKQKAVEEALKEARKEGNFAAIEKDYQNRLKAAEDKAAQATQQANSQLVENAQGKIISDLGKVFTAPEAMKPYLQSRLSTQIGDDGIVVTRVLDGAGQATAATIDDLKKEILDNPEFKPIIAAGKGSGSGATGHADGSGATSQQSGKFSDASVDDKVARLDLKMGAEG